MLPAFAAFVSYQLKDPLSVCLATGSGVDNATKPPVCLDNKVVALFVTTCLGTSWALPDQFCPALLQPHHCQAWSSVLDGWDGIFQLHPYSEHTYTLLFNSWTELNIAVRRPNRLTLLDQSSAFHAVKVTFM